MQVFVFLLFLLLGSTVNAQCIIPETGSNIHGNTQFCPGEFEVEDIMVAGTNMVIECNGTIFRGQGINSALRLSGAKNATIQGCHFSSYEVGVSIEDSKSIILKITPLQITR